MFSLRNQLSSFSNFTDQLSECTQQELRTFADWRELVVESSGQACASGRPDQQVALVARVLDAGADVEVLGDHRRVGRLLWPTARLGLCAEKRAGETISGFVDAISCYIVISLYRVIDVISREEDCLHFDALGIT